MIFFNRPPQTHRLAYITNAMLTMNDAQSVQISSMGKAFYQAMGKDFIMLSPSMPMESPSPFRRPIKCFFTLRGPRYGEFCIRMIAWLIRNRPGQVFTRDILLAVIATLLGIPATYEFHKECRTFTHEFFYRIFKSRISVVAISDNLGKFLMRAYKTPPEKIWVAHDGVFTQPYDALRSIPKNQLRHQLNLPSDATIVMHTGSLYPGRGAELFHKIIRSFPTIQFYSVGGRPQDIAHWQSKYDAFDNITFIPHQSQDLLVQYQMAADLLFLPMTRQNAMWWCTSPMKLFEYMASGVPILGTRIGSVGEVLNADNAILFDPESETSLSHALQTCFSDKRGLKEKAKQAWNDVQNNYTWQLRVTGILKWMNRDTAPLPIKTPRQ